MSEETSTPPQEFPFDKPLVDKEIDDVTASYVPATQPVQTPEEKAAEKKSLIMAEPSGVIRGSTFQEQYRLARCYYESGLMPKSLNSTEKVLVAIQLLHELSLPPMTSIGKVCVINGVASIFGELPLALVRRSGLLKSIEETCYLDEELNGVKLNYACCIARRTNGEEIKRFFSVDDAKLAGLWGKRSSGGTPSPWVLYPKRMLQMRARTWALKDLFPDVLFGVSVLEYDHNATIDTVVEDRNVADELNKKYLEKKNVVQDNVEKA